MSTGRISKLLIYSPLLWIAVILATTASAQSSGVPHVEKLLKAPLEDRTSTLSSEEIAHLDSALREYEASTTTQVAVLIDSSLSGYPIRDFSTEVFDTNRLGTPVLNNGLLIVLMMRDRQYYIAAGYGVEHALPDSAIAAIAVRWLVPNLRKGAIAEGLSTTISRLTARIDSLGIYNDDTVLFSTSASQDETGAVERQALMLQRAYRHRAELVSSLVPRLKPAKLSHSKIATLDTILHSVSWSQWNPNALYDDDLTTIYFGLQTKLTDALLAVLGDLQNQLDGFDASWSSLLVQLEGQENRIRVEKQRYNELARDWNEHHAGVPFVIAR